MLPVLAVVLLPYILLAQVPKLAAIPDSLPEPQHQKLTQTKESLVVRKGELVKKAADHNTKCSAVPRDTPEWKNCSDEQAQLEAERQRYIDAVNRFNEEIAKAIASRESLPATAPGPRIGAAVECRGAVFMLTPDGRQFPVQNGTPIPLYAQVTTGPDGHFQVLLIDDTVFTLGANSDMVLDEFVYDPNTSVGKVTAEVIKGALRFVTGKVARANPENMNVKLSAGVIGPRGTDVEAKVSPDGSGYIKVFSGQVEITEKKNGDLLLVNAGQMVTFAADGTFSPPTPLKQKAKKVNQ